MARWASDQVISAALAGDESSVESLISAVWPVCYRLAASLIGDVNLAQDAAQEACVIVHRKVRSLKNAAAFDAWMFRIVVREASRIRRRYAAGVTPKYACEFPAEGTEAVDVWRALAGLSPRLREVTVLFYFDDLKTEEIARILGVPHATVRTRLGRARDRLRSVPGDDIEPHANAREVKQHAC